MWQAGTVVPNGAARTHGSGQARPRGSGPGRDEPVTPPMVLRACERTERESKAVGWRPLAVYGLCLGPRICGCCHAMCDVTVRVA
jgi:hypothetical protein